MPLPAASCLHCFGTKTFFLANCPTKCALYAAEGEWREVVVEEHVHTVHGIGSEASEVGGLTRGVGALARVRLCSLITVEWL
jgi:hypothetical protein